MDGPEEFQEGRIESVLCDNLQAALLVRELQEAHIGIRDGDRGIEKLLQQLRRTSVLHETRAQLLQTRHGPQI